MCDLWTMPGIYGVGKAAVHPPALAVLSHTPEGATQTIAWVGKGIVYDTGGLSIKGKVRFVFTQGLWCHKITPKSSTVTTVSHSKKRVQQMHVLIPNLTRPPCQEWRGTVVEPLPFLELLKLPSSRWDAILFQICIKEGFFFLFKLSPFFCSGF